MTNDHSRFVPKAKKLKPIACLGTLTNQSIGEAKESASGNYWVQKILIKGIAGSPDAYINLTYHPDWLAKDFNAAEYFGEGNSDFLYRKSIYDPKGSSVLQGIAGSRDKFTELLDDLIALPEVTLDNVRNVLHDFACRHEGEKIGFYKTQKREKQADGQYVDVENYEAGQRWWFTDEKGLERVEMSIDKGDVIGGFDTSIPF